MTFGFLILVFDEPQKQIDACITSVRKAYPNIQIILISDGGPDIIVPAGCGYVKGEHLKEVKFGGAWIHRLCEVGLTLNTDKIIKIDPDTRILRPFNEIPDADYFGQLMRNERIKINLVRGGCKGYSRKIMQRAFDEKWFQDDFFTNPIFSYSKMDEKRTKVIRENSLSEDQLTAWVMFKHGIALTSWPEIMNENIDDPRYSTKHRVHEPCI